MTDNMEKTEIVFDWFTRIFDTTLHDSLQNISRNVTMTNATNANIVHRKSFTFILQEL